MIVCADADLDRAADGGKYGAADLVTKQEFRDFRLHVEVNVMKPGGNSGVYLQNRYEIQIKDGDQTKHGLGAVINETVVYQDVGRGFYATPRLNGRRVTLDISQQSASQGGYGSINSPSLSTTVSGRLGEWIELGGSGRQASGNQGGALSLSSSDARDNRSIWLMVEEVE